MWPTAAVYEHFAYGGARHVSIAALEPKLQDRSLIVNGMSKAYAMTGWRIGYGAGPLQLIKAVTLLLTQSTSCAASMSQVAAVTALQGPQDCVANAVELFETRRERMVGLLSRIPGIRCPRPDGAFYVFASVAGLIGARTASGNTLGNDLDVMMYFLDEAGVATIDGCSYGMPSYLRMSFATSVEQIQAGCAALAKAVSSLVPHTHPLKETTHA